MALTPPQQQPQQQLQQKVRKPGADLSPKPGMGYWEYFQYLLSQGIPGYEASQIIEANPDYGTPDQWNQKQQQRTEKANQYEGYGKVAGAVGTAALIDALRGKDYATSGSLSIQRQIPSQTLDLDAMAAQQGQTGAAATQYNPPVNQPQISATQPTGAQSYKLPDQQYGIGETTTVQTNAGPREVPVEAANDTGFIQGTDWSRVGQGAFAALQAYQAYQAFKQKDYVGAGISGTSAGLGAGATAYGAESTAAQYLPYAGGAAALYGGYQTAKLTGAMPKSKQRDVKATTGGAAAGAAGGAAIGSQIGAVGGPWGMAAGAVLGAAAGFAGSKFGSSKGKGQTLRDNLRATLQETGALDENFQGTLADGSKFDFGKDGSTLKWSNLEKVRADNQAAWDATSNGASAIAAFYKLTGQKNADVASWLQNAAVSNANNDPKVAMANMRHFAQSQGVDYAEIKNNLDTALADNKINQAQYDQIINGARDIFGENRIGSNVKPAEGMSTEEQKKRRKQGLAEAGMDLSQMSYAQARDAYLAGAISEEELRGTWPGGRIPAPIPKKP